MHFVVCALAALAATWTAQHPEPWARPVALAAGMLATTLTGRAVDGDAAWFAVLLAGITARLAPTPVSGPAVASSLLSLGVLAWELRARRRTELLPLAALSPILADLHRAAGVDLALACALALSRRGLGGTAGLCLGACAVAQPSPAAWVLVGAAGQNTRRGALAAVVTASAVALAVGLHPAPGSALGGQGAPPVVLGLVGLGVALAVARSAACGPEVGLRWTAIVTLGLGPVASPASLAPLAVLGALHPTGFVLAWTTAAAVAPVEPWAIVAASVAGLLVDAVRVARDPRRRPPDPPGPAPRISVLIPALDEEARIEAALERLSRAGFDEVVVIDGGSVDRTRELVARCPWARLISSGPGRGTQLRAGAAAATGDVLLFLHADVELPPEAARWVRATLSEDGVVAGAFLTRTVPDAGGRGAWSLLLADVRSRSTDLPYGDQAIFVRAHALEAVGGVPCLPLFEDWELARRLARVGAIRIVPACVRVSGRRYRSRAVRSALVTFLLPLLHLLGARPQTLFRLYYGRRTVRESSEAATG